MKQTVWMQLPADSATPTVRTTKPTLAEMQAAVGGLIEYAPVQGVRTMPFPLNGQVFNGTVRDVIVHEEGLLCAEPSLNVLGTLAAFGTVDIDTGRILVGDVIVVLDYDDDDEPFTSAQVEAWRKTQMPPRPKPEPVVRKMPGFVPISEPKMLFPDFSADGDDADEHTFAEFHGHSVENINEACQFYHALIFNRAVVLDPTKGFLTPQGFSAYADMTHTDAQELHRLNDEAVMHMEVQGLDAWTACANMLMATQLSLHLQAQVKTGRLSQEHFPHHAAAAINEMLDGGPLAIQPLPSNPDDYASARAHFAIDRITEWCAVREEHGIGPEGKFVAGLVNAVLLPPGWSEWMDDIAALLGGSTGHFKTDNAEADFQGVVDDLERSAGRHDDPDADDNDDDPFSEVVA